MYLLPGTDITTIVNTLSGPDGSGDGCNTAVGMLMNGTVVGMTLMDVLIPNLAPW